MPTKENQRYRKCNKKRVLQKVLHFCLKTIGTINVTLLLVFNLIPSHKSIDSKYPCHIFPFLGSQRPSN